MITINYDVEADPRPALGWDQAYPLANPHDKQTCSVSHCGVTGPDLMVTKHPHKKQPEGHLYTRCSYHQQKREQRYPPPA